MKKTLAVFTLALCLLFVGSAAAQDVAALANPAPGTIYAAGLSYGFNASPAIAGTALMAYPIAEKTYAVSVFDVIPNTIRPLTVTNNVGIGIGQHIADYKQYPLYCTTGAGISWTGSNTGWAYNFGCLTELTIKEHKVMPNVRFLKSSVSNGTGLQLILGGLYRF